MRNFRVFKSCKWCETSVAGRRSGEIRRLPRLDGKPAVCVCFVGRPCVICRMMPTPRLRSWCYQSVTCDTGQSFGPSTALTPVVRMNDVISARRRARPLSQALAALPAAPRAPETLCKCRQRPTPGDLRVSWGALGGVWAAGRGRFSFPSALPWGGPIWSPVSSSGLPTSRKMRSYWRESSRGLRG